MDAGFDLVVGGHSHVINGAEIYRGRLIAYSLGDLIADFAPMEPRAGALLEIRVVRAKGQAPRVTGFTWRPTLVERTGQGAAPPVPERRPCCSRLATTGVAGMA